MCHRPPCTPRRPPRRSRNVTLETAFQSPPTLSRATSADGHELTVAPRRHVEHENNNHNNGHLGRRLVRPPPYAVVIVEATTSLCVNMFPGFRSGRASLCRPELHVLDLYGKGVSGSTPEEFDALMRPFLEDRAMLADRFCTVVAAVAELPEVNPSRIAANGFCFGGLCVLDMARTGAAVTGVASFHGVLTPPPGWVPRRIDCKVAVYHGWEDPFAKPDDVVALAAELTASGADWQIQAFGQTMHSFMAEQANRPDLGVAYHARSADRAWLGLRGFLAECLDTTC